MRISLIVALALTAASCECGQKLSTLKPELVVTAPEQRDGEAWLLDFGIVRLGTTATRDIIITNRGAATASVQTLTLRSGSDPSFALVSSDPIPKELAVSGGVFKATISFTPSVTGSFEGFADLTTNDFNVPKIAVKVVAKSQVSSLEVCAETHAAGTFECSSATNPVLTIDYGAMLVNGPAVPRQVRITSKGSSALNYNGADFLDGTPLLFSLDPNQSETKVLSPFEVHTFAAVFTPAVDAALTGALEIRTDDPITPSVVIQLKALAATSLNCKIGVNPASAAFGSVPTGSSQDLVLSVSNSGALPCNLSNIAISGSPAFTFQANTAAASLPAKSSMQVKVHYAPAGESNDTGTLVITSDSLETPMLPVALSGNGIAPPDCVLTAKPSTINFGGTEVGDRKIASTTLTASGTDGFAICTLKGARLATPNTNFVMSNVTLGIVGGFGGGTPVGLTYAPAVARDDTNNLLITYQAGLFSGPTLTINVPITARAGTKRLCIAPARVHFGAVGVGVTKSLAVTLTACGGSAVQLQSMRVVGTNSPFAVPGFTPQVLTAGQSVMQVITATPTTPANIADLVQVGSDDPVFTTQNIPVDMGPETVPADAGEVMYTWQAARITTMQEGSVMRTNLQGPPNRASFYGTKHGESCAGCHTLSADGKFAALVEYGTPPVMRIVDTRTEGAIPIPNTGGGQFPSWNPNHKTTPPYQFIYNEGNVLKVASVTAGVIGTLRGSDDPAYLFTQPSWGPNGKIVAVRGSGTADAGDFSITGPTDLVIFDEAGGTPTAVPGASGTPGQNYLPEFSPNGKYIAFTFSAKGEATRSAPDSVVRLVEVATGAILTLPVLNAQGPNSWPTWSKDGLLLSFSSTRPGTQSADIFYAPVDQNSGVDGAAVPMTNVNTSDYDHISRWSFLPPP